MPKRYELSDADWRWSLIFSLLISALGAQELTISELWVLCSGAVWRDMPEPFGPWSTVYQRFRDWRNQGTFNKMLKRLHVKLNAQGLIDWNPWCIDSTAVRATRASSEAGQKGGGRTEGPRAWTKSGWVNETPNDISGVADISLDGQGRWKEDLKK